MATPAERLIFIGKFYSTAPEQRLTKSLKNRRPVPITAA
jgi:hypothetical protein